MSDVNQLTVLWTTDNLVTTKDMVFLYTHNAKKRGWWEDVTLVIWGASTVLAATNEEVREALRAMASDGVKLEACIACAKHNDAVEALEELGVEVKGWGTPLTEVLKGDGALLTV